jgi:L-ascorbate metabolism protein UlaG (beta-lactamase superfamily)/rhodanese-related sulfurtransferase
MMKRFLIVMAFSFFGLFSCKGYKDVTVNEFETMLAEDTTVQLVDVRTPEEYAEGHLGGALNIDWKADGFADKAQAQLDQNRPVLVYCRSGRRSAESAAVLDGLGFKTYNLKGGILAWTDAGKRVSKYEVERFWTASGTPVEITLIKHGSLEISYKGLSFQFDPVSGLGKPTDYAVEFPKADVILVTHEHGDHLEDATIQTLTGENTILLLNETSRNQIGQGETIRNGESRELPGGVKLEAVPAYNTTPGREMFHPQGNGNGYVLTIDGLRIYVAGDTEDVPEMADLKDIDVAFLPVNQPYTMTPEQCITAAKVIGPRVLIPYHYSRTDLSAIPEALPGIDVRIRQMQ